MWVKVSPPLNPNAFPSSNELGLWQRCLIFFLLGGRTREGRALKARDPPKPKGGLYKEAYFKDQPNIAL